MYTVRIRTILHTSQRLRILASLDVYINTILQTKCFSLFKSIPCVEAIILSIFCNHYFHYYCTLSTKHLIMALLKIICGPAFCFHIITYLVTWYAFYSIFFKHAVYKYCSCANIQMLYKALVWPLTPT